MNEKITLPDLINLLCEKLGMDKKEAELFVKSMFELIKEYLATDKYVKVKGLGTFKLTEVESRESVHVNTGERIEIQGHTKISFTPDTTMKDLINKPFAHFESVVLNDGVEFEDTPVEAPETLDIPEEVNAPAVEIPIEMEVPTQEAAPEVTSKEGPIEEEIVPEIVIPEEPQVVEEPEAEEEIVDKPEIAEEPKPEIVEETTIEELQPATIEVTEEEKPAFIEEKPSEEKVAEEKAIKEPKEKRTNRILWGIIVVLVLIILFGGYWMFLRSSDTPEVIPATPVHKEELVTPAPKVEVSLPKDTLKLVQFIELSEEELRKERVPSFADTLDYQIVGTQTEHTLQKGETIIRASVRFFGTKKYWPYIVKHNMDVLPDPDNIPAGIRIKIPKLVEK